MTRTRAEALAFAAQWAESAQAAYARGARAHEDAARLMRGAPGIAQIAKAVAETSSAEQLYGDARLELTFAQTWAAIAAATPED